METIPLSTSILGILAMEGRPLRLADIYKKMKTRSVSKPTIYRHLQNLVTKGLVSQRDEKYILVHGGDVTIMATDFARISELKPVIHETHKGFRTTVYSSLDTIEEVDQESLKLDSKRIIEELLSTVHPSLSGVFNDKNPTIDVLKKLVGVKFVLVTSFDGTDFSTLTSEETHVFAEKRRDVLKLLADTDGVTISELSKKLQLNVLQVRQIVDPILISGLAKMDESGKIKLTVEVKPIE